jgi:hypothetical protein
MLCTSSSSKLTKGVGCLASKMPLHSNDCASPAPQAPDHSLYCAHHGRHRHAFQHHGKLHGDLSREAYERDRGTDFGSSCPVSAADVLAFPHYVTRSSDWNPNSWRRDGVPSLRRKNSLIGPSRNSREIVFQHRTFLPGNARRIRARQAT